MALRNRTDGGTRKQSRSQCGAAAKPDPSWFASPPSSLVAFAPCWRSLAGALLLAAVGLVLGGCGAAERRMPCAEDARCLRYAITADIPVLDPHMSELPEAGMVFRQLYDTLVYRDKDSHQLAPGLATDWQVSADGLSYTFQLRQDVMFHDGSTFTAAAVGQNIQRIFQPTSSSSLARALLGPLQRFEILDDYTIRLHLFEPYAALLDGLAQPFLGMASPAALEGYDGLRYQYNQSGTGPFKLDHYLPGDGIVLRRFREYRGFGTNNEPLTGEEIDRIEISIIRDSSVDLLSLLGTSQDVIDDVSPAAAQALAGNSRVRLLPIAIPGQSAQFVFNTNRQHINNRDVRLALLLATNRIGISDQVFFNISPVAWAPLSEATGFAHSGYVNRFDFDLDQAQELLTAAGYADSDKDGILERAGVELVLTMLVPPWGQLPEVATLLQQQWRQIGIDLRQQPAPGKSQLASMIQSGKYDLLPVDNYGLDPAILGRIFLEDSHYASARARKPALQDLLIGAAQELEPARRRALYYEIQSLLMNEVLALPIRETVRLRAARANVAGLEFDAYGFYPLFSRVTITAN